jgi:pimeloyl-ACP methyl ester carboxylesterase
MPRYLESGHGRPVILLHAFPLSADMWRPQLDRVPGGWRFVAPDFRGFQPPGSKKTTSGLPSPSTTVDDYARDIVELMNDLGIETAVIGGLSMGGYVTLALYRVASERFAGMVLADTKATADTEEGKAGRRATAETLRDKGVGAVVDGMLPKLLAETTRQKHARIVGDVRALAMANEPQAVNEAIHALMARPDSTTTLARIKVPALVIVGEEDALTPPSDAQFLAGGIAGAELVVLPNAGHLSNLEAPDVFSAALAQFLSRLL